MKKLSLILLLAPAFCFAQTENNSTPKPAVDDCPSWNKKSKNNSKAEYFNYLRTNKAKTQQTINNYQNNSQKKYPSKAIVKYKPEEDPFLIPKRTKQNTPTNPIPHYASNASYYGRMNTVVNKPNVSSPTEKIELLKKIEPVLLADQKKKEEVAELQQTNRNKKAVKSTKKEKQYKKKRIIKSIEQKTKDCKAVDAGKCPSF